MSIRSPALPRERYLRTLRALARCFQAFERHSAAHVRSLALTPSQFDIIATLGNTPGMTFRELGDETLITKGTLTGVVDRLEARGLVRRVCLETDARSTLVQLTARGEAAFERAFPAHVAHLRKPFAALTAADLDALARLLDRLRDGFEAAA
jgi:DNA-binding MarR family transcriptional regulator